MASVSHVGNDSTDSLNRCSQIMKEIQNNGPVVASMNVYVDFLIYKTGLLIIFPNRPSAWKLTNVFSGVYSKS